MRKFYFLAAALCVVLAFRSKPGFRISGHIAGGIEGMKVYLRYSDGFGSDGSKPVDSTFLRHGRFVFTGHAVSTRFCTIELKDTATTGDLFMHDKVIELFVDPTDISVEAPYDSLHREFDKYTRGDVRSEAIVVKGGASQALYLSYCSAADVLRQQHTALFMKYIKVLNPDSSQVKQPRTAGMELAQQMDVADSQYKAGLMGFIYGHPAGPVTAYLASYALRGGNLSTTDVDELVRHFTVGKDYLVSKFLQDAPALRKIEMGSSLVDAVLKDTAGQVHSLSDYVGKGKYVLVECWASWCHPCRADIPHLKDVYSLYHPYGFDIVSVSLDDDAGRWKKAIDQEKMPWIQLSDLKGFEGAVPASYHINGIPHCLLFDPQGRLVTINMRGSWMDNRLIAMYGDHFPAAGMASVLGDVPGLKDGFAYFSYYADTVLIKDSAVVHSGHFEWRVATPETEQVVVQLGGAYHQFFAESGVIGITSADTGKTLLVTGGKGQEDVEVYKASIKALQDSERVLYASYGKASAAERQDILKADGRIGGEIKVLQQAFIKEHPGSVVSISLIAETALLGNYEESNAAFAMLSDRARNSGMGRRLAGKLAILRRGTVGQQMIDFTQNDTTGTAVRFDLFKGKYVLLDLWASWCGPCRAENPNVLKAYNAFKNKNFTVVGVSMDDDGKRWKKAIREDKMPWTQLSDLKGGIGNVVAAYYGIQAIPSNFLIDPSGKIIARNLRGEELARKLGEVLE